jgi:hypothetical protein
MSAMCVIYTCCIHFHKVMHASMKMYDVMLLYLFLCDISCHMHHGFICHTLTPHRCNDLGGVSTCLNLCN